MDSTKAAFKDRVVNLMLQIVLFGWIIGLIAFCILPIAQQAMSWLKFGTIPDRDLYWLFSPVSCAETNWKPGGWHGMDLCRQPHIQFMDWVGVNRIIDWFFDIHIAAAFVITTIAGVIAFNAIMETGR